MLASLAMHLVLGGGLWLANRSAAAEPRMRVYAVNIVSPPPREQGEWSPAAAGEPEVAEEPAPEPEPTPPAPEPEPVKEPSPAPKATTRPEPPAPRAQPKETPRPPAKETARPKETPKPAAKAPEKPAPKATETGKRGSGGASDRPSTGARPDASSAGGEDLDVRTEGARFMEPGYLENIVRQVNRYFRRPAGSTTDEAEVRFWINRDGTVSDIEVIRASGSFRFRAAAMEAVEQAGNRKAFGPLPKAYPADRLPVSFYFRPAN